MNKRTFWLLLSLILLFSLATRLVSLQHGLPYTQITDENSDLSTALRLLEGEIPARHVRYHRSLVAYIDLTSIGGLFGYGYLTGQVSSIDDFRNLYFSDRALFTVATRLMFAGLTTLALLLVALTGRYINEWVGLLAAAVLAVNGFFMLNSLYALPDGLGMVAVALCLWLAMRLLHKHRTRDYFLAGIGSALVMLSKFNGITVGISIVAAHTFIVLENHKDADRFTLFKAWLFNRHLIWLGAGVVIGNILFNPLPFLYPADLIWELQRLRDYAYGSPSLDLMDRLQIIGAHITDTIVLMWRWLIPASVVGFIAFFYNRRHASYWVIVSAFVILFITTANVTTISYKVFFWTSWLIPMSLVSAIGFFTFWRYMQSRKWLPLAYGLTITIFLLEGLFFFQVVNIMRAADTRDLARSFIAEQMPPDTRILTGEPLVYSVPLDRNETSITRARALGAPDLLYWDWWLAQAPAARSASAYDLFGPEVQTLIETYEDAAQLIQDEAIEYVIETDYCNGTQNRPESNSAEEFPAISGDMHDNWTLVAVFSPFAADTCLDALEPRTALVLNSDIPFNQQVRSGPLIRIYRTNQ
jgi:Dolichyl-phosphate-mannose-protein mannosyltransferase